MSRIKQHCAARLGSLLADLVQLGQKPIVIDAPPSQNVDYPAIAVWIEHAVYDIDQDRELLVDASGTLLVGAAATDANGNILDGSPLMLVPGVTVSHVGTIQCKGRLWVGARYPAKREEIEEKVGLAFLADRDRPLSIMVPLSGCTVGDYTITFGYGFATVLSADWNAEHSFEARLWSWMPFTIDMPLLIPRSDAAVVQTMTLSIQADLKSGAAPITAPSQLAGITTLDNIPITATSP